ncbi:MAG: hypothetical protein LBI39_03485 [Puniceicoccales bacterium]|nr:hypothetical protein [Puniceicoccales bacterium]
MAVEIFDGPRISLSYAIPAELAGKIFPGSLVAVPLKSRLRVAVAVGLERGTFAGALRPVAATVGNQAPLGAAAIELARWTAFHYGNCVGDVLKLMVPRHLRKLPKGNGKAPAKGKAEVLQRELPLALI